MKKVFFSLFAVVIAVSGSAFTNVKAIGSIYGSNTTADYTLRTPTTYDSEDCNATTVSKVCAYQVTEAGESIVTAASYTPSELAAFKANGQVVELGIGLYMPN